MCAMHKDCMLHQVISNQGSICSCMPLHAEHSLRMLLHAHTCRPLNQELQQVFIDKHLQGTPPFLLLKK